MSGDAFVSVQLGDPPSIRGLVSCRIANGRSDTPDRYADAWARWNWNGTTLTAATDPYGFQPLYYWADGHRIALAQSPLTLIELGAPRDLDCEALTVFVRVGYFLNQDTPFRHVHALPRGGMLQWSGGDVRVSTSVVPPDALSISSDTAIDTYIGLVRDAVRRRLPDPSATVTLPLSGGRDSRHLLFELADAGCRPNQTVTVRHFPTRPDDDANIAPEIAAAVGTPHTTLLQRASRVRSEIRKNVLTGFCSDKHAWILPLMDFLGRTETKVIYDGLLGGVLTATHHERFSRAIDLIARRDFTGAAHWFLTRADLDAALLPLLRSSGRRALALDAAVSRIAAEFESCADWPHPWGAFWWRNRTARDIALAPFALLARQCTVVTPYLDPALLDFMFRLPPAVLLNQPFHEQALARAFPQYRSIPYDDDRSGGIGPHRWHAVRFGIELAEYAARTRAATSSIAARLSRERSRRPPGSGFRGSVRLRACI